MIRTRIPAIARKELLHVVRDWRTLAMAFVLPMALLLLFGYAITFDIKHLRLVVADEDQTGASRELIRRFTAGDYFKLVAMAPSAAALPHYLDAGQAQLALAIPRDFAKTLEAGRGVDVQTLVDGTESNTATIAGGYLDAIFAAYNMEQIKGQLLRRGVPVSGLPPLDAQVRVWFNPEVDSSATIVPGLVAVNMVLMAALLTSLTIVRERELGSLESLFATPVRRLEILVGKILPYLGIALLDCVLSALIGVAVFDVPFRGSVALFLGTSLIFTFTGLSIGLLASVISSTAMLSNQLVVLTTMLPSMLLSGFMFPIASMPGWVQAITYAVPARYFVAICRGIMLKAQPWTALVGPTLLLLAVGAVLFTLANLRFRKKL